MLIGGGKERMASLLTPEFVAANRLPADDDGRRTMLAQLAPAQDGRLHRDGRGREDARPARHRPDRRGGGRGRLAARGRVHLGGAVGAGRARARRRTGLAADFAVFAGDIVPAKKPAPAIYQLAVRDRLASRRTRSIVVEDSGNGLRAALGAGLACVVTVSTYTVDEDFTGAALVVSASATRTASGPPCWPTRSACGRTGWSS